MSKPLFDEPFSDEFDDEPFADDKETGERATDPALDGIEETEADEEIQQAIVCIVDTTPAPLADMTEEEARHALSQLLGTVERQKFLLLEMHERNAHKAMRYSNWERFANEQFGMSYRRFNELLSAARAERDLGGIPPKSQAKTNPQIAPNMAEQVYVELGRLGTPELIQRAWKEMSEATSSYLIHRGKDSFHNGKITAKYTKKVVDSLLRSRRDDGGARPH